MPTPTRLPRPAAAVVAAAALLLASGCGAGEPAALPTIGSPSPSATPSPVDTGRAAALAKEWDLVGVPLPDDWPDIPLPAGTEVTTAYAIGAEPRRTWTATFAADRGTALDMAEPIVAEMRSRGYRPIAEYVGAAATNTGLYSFAAPTFAVFVILGEDNGRPNVGITVRGTNDPNGALPPELIPTLPETTPPASPGESPATDAEPSDGPTPSLSPQPSAS
jgi:hypothetical protein